MPDPKYIKVYDPEAGAYVWEEEGAAPVVVGESQTAPPAGSPSAQNRAGAAEFALSSLPTLGAGIASLATGPAAPLTATATAALLGGFLGKGVEMGLRTGTGVGAETVPPTMSGRLLAGAHEGAKQSMFEVGAGFAARAAAGAARATVYHAERSALGKAMRQEQKVLGKQADLRTDYERALARNDEEIERIENSLAEVSREMDVAKGNAKIAAQQKYDALLARKRFAQQQATEEALRIDKIEAAAASADRALAATGAGVPEFGQLAAAHKPVAESLIYRLEKDTIEGMGAAYVGLEKVAAERAAAPIDTRPLFKKTIETIRNIPKLKGVGQNFTEVNEILAKLESDWTAFAEAAPKPAAKAAKSELDPLTLTPKKPVQPPPKPGPSEQETLGGLLVMQGNLSQEIAKLELKGPSGERAAKVLRRLRDDTDAFIESKMLEAGWQEGPAALKAVRKQWADKSSFMEHQVFQILKKDPSRAHELLTVDSGYTPVVKKVLKDAGAYEFMWPEVRRKWLEQNFVRNGKLDFSAFVEGARANEPILKEIFDTPEAMAQFRRIHLPAMRLEALKGKAMKSVADNVKYTRLQGEIQKIGEEMAAIDGEVDKTVQAIMDSGTDKVKNYRAALAEARGYKRDQLKMAFEQRNAAFAAQLDELGMLRPGVSRDIFGPIPRILMYRGAAGMLAGTAAGLAGGGFGGIMGAMGGLAGGYALNRADQAIVRRLLYLADNPAAMQRMMQSIDQFERGVAKAGPALRAALLGQGAVNAANESLFAKSH